MFCCFQSEGKQWQLLGLCTAVLSADCLHVLMSRCVPTADRQVGSLAKSCWVCYKGIV
jgi:hypothetical protein